MTGNSLQVLLYLTKDGRRICYIQGHTVMTSHLHSCLDNVAILIIKPSVSPRDPQYTEPFSEDGFGQSQVPNKDYMA